MANMVKEVDDVLLFSGTVEGIADGLEDMLIQFKPSNITLAQKNFSLGRKLYLPG